MANSDVDRDSGNLSQIRQLKMITMMTLYSQ